ncbi:MAG TPA: trigger factor [Usitatibacteraceae bacterium]|nr:trigger factor [Usitatibacteraceae bacterium]
MQAQATPAAPSALERNIVLSLPAVEIESQINSRLKQIARTAKMSGFRPGKVPFNIVANQYGFQVRQEVMSDTVQRSFAEAVKAQNLRVAGYPRFAPANSGQSADKFEFTATFEVYPEIRLGSLADKKLQRPVAEVQDHDVDNTLETLRKQRANYDKADRAAQKGDFLVIDFNGTIDGVPFEGGSAENFGVVLGEGRMLPDFEAALGGMSAGETKSFDLVFPGDYQPAVAGKAAKFAVTVKIVNAPVLPAIDGEFARSLGVADGDVAKMRSEIKANLERELKKRVRSKTKDQVLEALASVTQVELPKSLVNLEVSRLQEQAVKDLEARGMTTKDMQLPPELFVERAEKRVKLGLILSEVIRQHDLKAAPEQIRAVVEEHAESFEDAKQMVRWYYSEPERLAEVEAMVLEDNVVEWAAKLMQVETVKQSFDEVMEIKRT